MLYVLSDSQPLGSSPDVSVFDGWRWKWCSPSASNGTAITRAPASSTTSLLLSSTSSPHMIHGCLTTTSSRSDGWRCWISFHTFSIRAFNGKRSLGSRISGWGGLRPWSWGNRLTRFISTGPSLYLGYNLICQACGFADVLCNLGSSITTVLIPTRIASCILLSLSS